MSYSTMRSEEVIGRFFTLRGDTECKKNEHLRWTLKCLVKGFPSGHTFGAADYKDDCKGRPWALMSSVRILLPNGSCGPED